MALSLVLGACDASITGLVVTQPTGSIIGTVREPDGSPAAGVSVRLEPAEGPEQTTRTLASGSFAFVTLEGGLYLVELLPPDGFRVMSENPLEVVLPDGETAEVEFAIGRLVTDP